MTAVAVESFGFDAERQRLARELFTTRFRLGVLRSAGFGIAILVFLLGGVSAALRDLAGDGPWWIVFAYFAVLYFGLWFAGLPFAVMSHRLEVRYGLSRQTWKGWALDDAKSLAVSLRRSPDCTVDLSHLAGALGGGGHAAAAGCEVPELRRELAEAVAVRVARALEKQ